VNKETKKVNKTPRSEETRTTMKKAKQPWTPPSMLAVPNDPPPGVKYRWIRAEVLGFDDRSNVSKRFREGWEPVRPEEVPGYDYPTIDEGRHAGVVGVGGLILCKIDEDVVEQRDQYYQQQTANQMTAVDNDLMREENPAMPISRDRKSKVTFGGGTK
tara:strand:- start:123 stop:596 length:474 start_codon:yes stop_codon:yes gene_type:complete